MLQSVREVIVWAYAIAKRVFLGFSQQETTGRSIPLRNHILNILYTALETNSF